MKDEKNIIHQDNSTASYYLRFWWNWIAQFVPEYIAPNVITFMGGLIMFSSFIVSVFTNNSTAVLYHCFSVFVLQTLDALDGIQARKLNKCSNLGSFIDHYTDVWTIQMMFVTLFKSIQLSYPFCDYALLFINMNVYLAHWETLHTKILYFPDGFSITETQILVMIMHLVSYVYPSIWKYNIYSNYCLNELLVTAVCIQDMLCITVPLIKRVVKKTGWNVLHSLKHVLFITFILGTLVYNKVAETEITRIGMLNIPYIMLMGKLLLECYTSSLSVNNRHVYVFVLCLLACWMYDLSPTILILVYTYLAGRLYVYGCIDLSNELNVPIF